MDRCSYLEYGFANYYLIKTVRGDWRRHFCPELLFDVGRNAYFSHLDKLICLAMNE